MYRSSIDRILGFLTYMTIISYWHTTIKGIFFLIDLSIGHTMDLGKKIAPSNMLRAGNHSPKKFPLFR
jgi:hypothetical protein